VARPVGIDAPPGILRQTRAGSLEALSPEGKALLERGGQSLAEAAMAVIAEADGNQGRAVVVNAGGDSFALHATTFDGAPAAIVEAPRPAVLADQIIRAWGLTKREREVVSRVLAGEATKEIAGGLQISEYTVQDHLKAIFDKAGVSSRRELVAALLQQHYLPEMARGATPSPYGWYLPA
jgi:DNA-binding CsgD family transcriptional regulator